MARYIDAEELKRTLKSLEPAGYERNLLGRITLKTIDVMPTADVAPKGEVATEIFAEIDRLIYKVLNDKHYIMGDMVYDVAELKKKYIGE